VPASFNYVADVALIARSRVAAYVAVNVGGTVAALGAPIALMSAGVGAAGLGWALGQFGYMIVAAVTIAADHRRASV
ncbi:MAG TPA: hypothetical protein VMU14_09200, partial [Acidimicrobiales bacterium]|nr:hypothetical protein [Acidimicrobiales bacterium]